MGPQDADIRMETLTACPVCSSIELQTLLESEDFDYRLGSFRIDSCQSCGVRFTNPRPIAEDVHLLYTDTRTEPLPTGETLLGRIRRARLSRRILGALGDRTAAPLRCADIGAGDGFFAQVLSEEPFCKTMVAVDFHPEPPPLLREAVSEGRLLFQSQDAFLASPETYDVIFARFVLEHVGNPKSFIGSLRPKLVPGGLLVVEVPNWDSIWRRLFGRYFADLCLPFHTFHLDPKLMPDLMPGFHVEVRTDIHGVVLGRSLGNLLFGGSARMGPLGLATLPVEMAVDRVLGPPGNMTVLGIRTDD